MSYDAYKDEAYRLLCRPDAVLERFEKFIKSLRCDFVPAVAFGDCHDNSYSLPEEWAMTISGRLLIVEDRVWSIRHGYHERRRKQTRWLSRKLREYGQLVEAEYTRVSTDKGEIRFTIHFRVPQHSHLTDAA